MISLFRRIRKQRRDIPTKHAGIDIALLDSRVLFSATPLAATVDTAEDAPDFDVDLHEIFTIDDDTSGITFEVQSQSQEHIQALSISEDGVLHIELEDDANGIADISILASVGELSQALNLTLDIESVNDSPEFLGFTEVESNANVTTVNLHSAFEDVEDADSDLTFAVSTVSNEDAFASWSIDQSTGILTLVHAADAKGVAEIIVTATDSEGLTTGNATPEGFKVYDHLSIPRDEFPVSPDDLGLTKLQFWTGWYFFDKIDGEYDYSQLDADGFEDKIEQYASNRSKVMFDIENDYYVNTPEGRDRFAEVLHIASETRANLDIGIYRIMPERQWWNSVNWARAQEDAAEGFETYYTRNYDHFKERYEAWHDRNELFRTETVSAEFGGRTLADMVDTIYPSLYTFFWSNTRTSTQQYPVELDSATNTLTTPDPKYLQADWLYLRAAGGWMDNGLFQLQKYYIVNRDGNSFQLSHTEGGEAIDFNDAYGGYVHAQSFDVWDMSIDRNTLDWATYARENIAEARKFEGKDVVPWISPSVYGQGVHYISGDFFRTQLETTKQLADSVSLFDFNGTWQNQGWWTAVSDFMESLDDPAASLEIDFDALVQISPVPAPQNDHVSTVEDQALVLAPSRLLQNDVNAGGTDLQIVNSVENGTLTWSDSGELIYRPDQDFYGTDSFTYNLVGVDVTSGPASVLIDVDAVNDAPTAHADRFRTLDSEALSISMSQLTANDVDIDSSSLQVEIIAGPSNGLLTAGTGDNLSYRANDGFSGIDQFMYRVFDGHEYSNAVSVAVDVISTQSIANADDLNVDAGSSVSVSVASLLSNDVVPDSSRQEIQITRKPKYGKIFWANDGESFEYIPNEGFSGSDTIEYKVVTDHSDSNVALITIHVEADELPDISGTSFTLEHAGEFSIPVEELFGDAVPSDAVLAKITFEITHNAQHGHATFTAGNQLQYTPDSNFIGTDVVQYRLVSADGTTAPVSIEFHVVAADPNEVAPQFPIAVDDSFEIEQDSGLNIPIEDLLVNDELGETAFGEGLSFEIVSSPNHGQVTITPDNRLHYSPPSGFRGTDQFLYRLTNEDGSSEAAVIEVVVSPTVEDVPKSGSRPVESFGVKQGGGLNIAIEDLLLGGVNSQTTAGLDVEIAELPQHGTATITPDGRIHYSPFHSFLGTDRVVFQLSNPDGSVELASIDFIVYPEVAAIAKTGEQRVVARRESSPPDSAWVAFELAARRGEAIEGPKVLAGDSDDDDEFVDLLLSPKPTDWTAKLALKIDA